MFNVLIENEELLKLPEVQTWVKSLKELTFSENEVDLSKISFITSFGFFVPKSQNTMDKLIETSEITKDMLFEERLNYELSKTRVQVTLQYGKNFAITNRLPKGSIPTDIVNIVKELTKVKMTIEFDVYGNQEVKDSIPEIDKSVVDFQIIKDVVDNDYKDQNVSYDIDDILDKINDGGFDSLTDDEREFLDNKSKE